MGELLGWRSGDGYAGQRHDLPDGSDTLFAATHGRSIWTTSLADIS